MANITLSGKVQRVYEGRRFSGSDGQPVDAISFDLCVSRDGAREEVNTTNGEVKGKCDFYRCHVYGKKAVDFYRLTANNPKRIVTVTGNMLQEEKPCTNRPIHIGKDNPLFQLLSQYVQASNGLITVDASGDIWIKGDYIFDKAVKLNVHTFNFLDYPGAQQGNTFGVDTPASTFGMPAQNNMFGTQAQNASFGMPAQSNSFGMNTAGSFGIPAQNNTFGTQATGGQQVGGFPAQSGFQPVNTSTGFSPNGQAPGFPITNSTGIVQATNEFEVINSQQTPQVQAGQQAQSIAGFPVSSGAPVAFTPAQVQQAPPVQATQVQQAQVDTNIPAPSNSAMSFAPVTENTEDAKRPF